LHINATYNALTPGFLVACRGFLLTTLIVLFGTGCASTNQGVDVDQLVQGSVEQLIEQGLQNERQGNYPKALLLYYNAAKIEPNADLWKRIARIQFKLGDDYQALSALGNVTIIKPDDAQSLEALGLMYLKLKHKNQAEEALIRAVELDVSRWKAYNGLGIIADLDREHALAVYRYQTALKIQPESTALLNNLGYSRFLANTPEQAADDLIEALRKDRSNKTAWNNLGMVFARQGRYMDAFEILEHNYPEAIAYHDVGYVALINGDWATAEAYLTKALTASPRYFEEAYINREAARNRLAGSTQGSIVVRKGAANPYTICFEEFSC